MHVVGDERRAAGGEASCHGPVVAAGLRHALARGCGRGGCRRGAYVEHAGIWHGRLGRGRLRHGGVRGIPGGAARVQELHGAFPTRLTHRTAQALVDLTPQYLAPEAVDLQIPPHGIGHEHGVLGAPGGGLLPEDPVLPRARTQRRKAGVDAARVRLEHGALLGTCLGDDLPRDSAEPEKPRLAILLECHRTEEFRELPGREAPREVHLEEAILGVEEAGGEGKIAPIGGLDRRHAARIAGDAHRGGELGLSQLPVELRQRAAQAQVGAQQERKQQQRAQHAEVLQLSHARVFGLASPA